MIETSTHVIQARKKNNWGKIRPFPCLDIKVLELMFLMLPETNCIVLYCIKLLRLQIDCIIMLNIVYPIVVHLLAMKCCNL